MILGLPYFSPEKCTKTVWQSNCELPRPIADFKRWTSREGQGGREGEDGWEGRREDGQRQFLKGGCIAGHAQSSAFTVCDRAMSLLIIISLHFTAHYGSNDVMCDSLRLICQIIVSPAVAPSSVCLWHALALVAPAVSRGGRDAAFIHVIYLHKCNLIIIIICYLLNIDALDCQFNLKQVSVTAKLTDIARNC